jgi:uncharacterized membrane protein (DUF106 family)
VPSRGMPHPGWREGFFLKTHTTMVLDNLFLLQLHPFLAISLVTCFITLSVTVLYKYTTDQKKLKQLKDDQKKMQDDYKKNMNNPKKAMEINKKLMSTNFEYMKHSFKSTLYTFIPLLIIFAWMNTHLGYEQLYPNTGFTITPAFEKGADSNITILLPAGMQLLNNATIEPGTDGLWKIKGKEGLYTINYTYGQEFYQQQVVITKDWKYISPKLDKSNGKPPIEKISSLKSITVNLESTKPMKGVPILGGLNWLWTYILLSVGFSLLFRKLFKVF